MIHGCSRASCGDPCASTASPWTFWLPDGDWLERRTLLAASPLDLAVPLHFGASTMRQVSHFLSIPDEVDLYSVTLQRGDTLDASIDAQQAGSGLDEPPAHLRCDGTPLALDNQQGGDPHLTFQAATAGTYYVGVSSAPNDNYNPTVAGSGIPGGTTGLYTLDVKLTTSAPLLPDLTGSSFRTGVDMAAAGDRSRSTSPSRTAAAPTRQLPGPGAAGRQQPSSTARRRCWRRSRGRNWWPTRRAGLLVAGRLQRDAAGGHGRRGRRSSACASSPTRRCPRPACTTRAASIAARTGSR